MRKSTKLFIVHESTNQSNFLPSKVHTGIHILAINRAIPVQQNLFSTPMARKLQVGVQGA